MLVGVFFSVLKRIELKKYLLTFNEAIIWDKTPSPPTPNSSDESLIMHNPNHMVFSPSEFSGQHIHSSIVFNPVELSSVSVEEEEDSELKGPVVRKD